jgi:hypothetical protein
MSKVFLYSDLASADLHLEAICEDGSAGTTVRHLPGTDQR